MSVLMLSEFFHHGFKSRTSASFVMSRLLKTTLYIDSFISECFVIY